MGKGPFSFDGCHICTASRQAEQAGRSLSYEELTAAFKEQERKQQRASKQPASSGQSDGKQNGKDRAQ